MSFLFPSAGNFFEMRLSPQFLRYDHNKAFGTRRHKRCPNACGFSMPFSDIDCHLKKCPNEEVDCPNHALLSCSSKCPCRVQRKDLEANLLDSFSTEAVMGHLIRLAVENTSQLLSAIKLELTSRLDPEARVMIDNSGLQQRRLYLTLLASIPCDVSKNVLLDQLCAEQIWNGKISITRHLYHEFHITSTLALHSPMVNICDGVQGWG